MPNLVAYSTVLVSMPVSRRDFGGLGWASDLRAGAPAMPNHVRFFSIMADDVSRARKFYETLFGWTFEDWGPPGFYLIRGAGIEGSLHARQGPPTGNGSL